MAAPTRLCYRSEDRTPETGYVLDFMFRAIGVPSRPWHPGIHAPVDIYYGSRPPRPGARVIIDAQPGCDVTSALAALARESPDVGRAGARIPFDLVRIVRYLLLDSGNAGAARDGLDRVTGAGSVQTRHGILSQPLVNRCLLMLRDIVRDRLGIAVIPFWPAKKTYAVALSHDVDEPDRRCFCAESRSRLQRFSDAVRARRPGDALQAAAGLGSRLARLPLPGQGFWLFRPIMDEEERCGARSTFFVASRSLLDPGADRIFDVAYRITRDPYRRALRAIAARGFDIGLHASFRSFQSTARLRLEREVLEAVAGTPVLGVRHHRLHLGPDPERTLRFHEAAGFAYDSSLAFNDVAGFRRSIALPFAPWSAAFGRPVGTVQIPITLMDAHLLAPGQTADRALAIAGAQIDAVKRQEGMAVLNWHVQTALPHNRQYRMLGEVYQALLARLACDPAAWVTSLSEVLAFTRQRWAGLGYR